MATPESTQPLSALPPRATSPTPTRSTRARVIHALTLTVALSLAVYTLWVLWTILTLRPHPPFAWTLHITLVEAGPPALLTIGFLCATAHRSYLRYAGWLLIVATLVAYIAWARHALPPHGVAANTITTPAVLHVALLGCAFFGALANVGGPGDPLDEATRERLVQAAYFAHSDDLFRFVAYYARHADSMAAEDTVQETFAALYAGEHDDALTRDTSGLRAHLFTTVKRRIDSTIRSENRRDNYEAEAAKQHTTAADLATSPDVQYDAIELGERIELAITQCPPRPAEAFYLVRVCGCSYAETAEIMQITVKAVGAHLVVATARIRNFVADWLSPSTPQEYLSEEGSAGEATA